MDTSEYLSIYRRDGIVKISSFTDELPSSIEIKLLADEACDVHGLTVVTSERIQFVKTGSDVVESRKVTSRLENFVSSSKKWTELCCTGGILSRIVGLVCSEGTDDVEPWCLYKEKLNIKPAGSSGFAPHLDSPSLRVTGLCDTFVTVMIAIDDMTVENGCLQVCRGSWTEANSVPCEDDTPTGVGNSNPDGNGRKGAIRSAAAAELVWEPVECLSGDVFIFSGWLPHRSACNASQLPRRAVFLTYNHSEDGELSETYYRIMRDLRAAYLKQYIAEEQCRLASMEAMHK